MGQSVEVLARILGLLDEEEALRRHVGQSAGLVFLATVSVGKVELGHYVLDKRGQSILK